MNIPLSGEFFVGLDIWSLTCAMMFYSFLGWFYESTIFSLIEQGKFMNRGCFIGPYCPIYSVVCVLNLYLLAEVTSPVKIVFISSVTCCVVEYITSVTLEKLFNARYWDYSYFPLNINGRVSVVSGLFFGFAVLFLIKLLHPFTVYMLDMTPLKTRFILGLVFWIVFILDAVFTTICMMNLNRKCKEIYDAWDNLVEAKLDVINNKKESLDKFLVVEKSKDVIVKLKGINKKFVEFEALYIKNHDYRSTKYGAVVEKIKGTIKVFSFRKEKNPTDDYQSEETLEPETVEAASEDKT